MNNPPTSRSSAPGGWHANPSNTDGRCDFLLLLPLAAIGQNGDARDRQAIQGVMDRFEDAWNGQESPAGASRPAEFRDGKNGGQWQIGVMHSLDISALPPL